MATFRSVLGHFCTGLTVVSAIESGEPVGMTCQSFTSVSLDPPLVSFLPARTSTSYPRIRDAGRFTVNVLHEGQERLCQDFSIRGADKWAGVEWAPGTQGAPRLEGALAWIDCELWKELDAGDHLIVLGRVLDLQAATDGAPLLYYQGRYGRLHRVPSGG
jgi:flavin reductase (DIM6/NTAB) family NADH-FMN oxidoreductase RutF